jgi:hypothetical protein
MDEPSVRRRMPTIDPKDLVSRTFLKDSEADGQRFRARIVRAILDHDTDLKREPNHVKFLCEVDGDTADAIYTYNQVLGFIERDNLDMNSDMEQLYRFWRISVHQGPQCKPDADSKGVQRIMSLWNGRVGRPPTNLLT